MLGPCPLAAIAALAGLLFCLGAAHAAEPADVGGVTAVRVWAYGTPPGGERDGLFTGNRVVHREQLETVEGGALHVRLRDGTDLRLGSNSQVLLDEFVYDPNAGPGAVVIGVTKGVCRFVTGSIGSGLRVETSVATIVPRGTEFSVWIREDGSTLVWVQDGTVEVTPRRGTPALVHKREIVRVATPTGAVERNATRPESDPGLQITPKILLERGKDR
jgi:hypothetical protein